MSFEFSGAASSRMSRTGNMPASSNAFTMTFWAKRTSALSGLKHFTKIAPNPENTAHEFVLNDSAVTPEYSISLQANWASTIVHGDVPNPLNTWAFYALVGSGSNITMVYEDTGDLVFETISQTAITPYRIWIADAGSNSNLFIGRFAHIRIWGAALSNAEVLAEKNSATVVRTSNLLSAHSGLGGDIATALAGETGDAWVAGSGGVGYSTDTPTIESFSGAVISGEAIMPSEALPEEPAQGARINRWLYSEDMSQTSVWNMQGASVVTGAAAPPGYGYTSRRVRLSGSQTGGIYGIISNVPSGDQLSAMIVKKVDTNFICFRHMTSDFGNGAQGHFDLVNGTWYYFNGFGTFGTASAGFLNLGNGWYLIYIVCQGLAGSTRHIEFYPIETGGNQVIATGKALDVGGFQFEPGTLPHYYKPTTSAIVSRLLDSLTVTANVSSVAVNGQFVVTATALDDAGAPWDTASPLVMTSSVPTVAAVGTPDVTQTDWSGKVSRNSVGLSAGTTNFSATLGGLTSNSLPITVGGSTSTRWVRIRCEPGWHGTAGWYVGVWAKPAAGVRFPTAAKLFESSNQAFKSDAYSGTGESYMDVAVPVGVTLAEGADVEVALENDNINGEAVDGPGVFSAVVI